MGVEPSVADSTPAVLDLVRRDSVAVQLQLGQAHDAHDHHRVRDEGLTVGLGEQVMDSQRLQQRPDRHDHDAVVVGDCERAGACYANFTVFGVDLDDDLEGLDLAAGGERGATFAHVDSNFC